MNPVQRLRHLVATFLLRLRVRLSILRFGVLSIDLPTYRESMYLITQVTTCFLVLAYLAGQVITRMLGVDIEIDVILLIVFIPIALRQVLVTLHYGRLGKILAPHLFIATVNFIALYNLWSNTNIVGGLGLSFTLVVWMIALELAGLITSSKYLLLHASLIAIFSLLSINLTILNTASYFAILIFVLAVAILLIPITHSVERLIIRNQLRLQQLRQLYDDDRAGFYELAHNLKTPLTILLVEAVKLAKKQDQDTQELVQRLVNEVRQSAEGIMTLAKMHMYVLPSDIAAVDMEQFIQNFKLDAELLAMHYQNVTGKRRIIKFKSGLPKNQARLPVEQVRNVLLNIIDNSIKHNPGKEQLIVQIEVSYGKNQWKLRIKDNGEGISHRKLNELQKDQDVLSRSAVTSRMSGLYIARKLVENAGGSFHIYSQTGRGTTVDVSFPFVWQV